MHIQLLFSNQIRISENYDWVVFMLLGCTVLYLFLMNILQRDASIKSYLLQDYTETNNIFQSWIVIGIITVLLFSTLLLAVMPVIPLEISSRELLGYTLSDFGFTFLAVLLFYVFKCIFSYFFFHTLGGAAKWNVFCYASSKFYFIISLVLLVFNFVFYFFNLEYKGNFYELDPDAALNALLFFAIILIIGKNIYYLLNKNDVLPFKWYYKILYICTLQIAPVLVLCKLLFI